MVIQWNLAAWIALYALDGLRGTLIGPLMDPCLPLGSAADFVSGQRF